jgi:hypothetical protein
LLGQVESTLKSLHSEFSNIRPHEEHYATDLGSADIASAMDGFATNWNYHKGKMLTSMAALCKNVHECRTETRNWDAKLKTEATKGH